MAGSAINLSGMLSQLSGDVGRMGNTVGQGLFNPMLQIQEEQRAERRAKELEAMKLQKLSAMQTDIHQSNNALSQAQLNQSSDGNDVAAARAALQEKAKQNPAMAQAYLEQDAKLAQAQVALQTRGHLKGVNDIDKALADETLAPEAREALTQRRAQLMQTPGVASAVAAQNKAQRAARIQQMDLLNKEAQYRDIKYTDAAAGLSQAVLSGADLSKLKAQNPTIPAQVWAKVDKTVADWSKAKMEAERYAADNKDNSSDFEGTPYEQTYKLLLDTRGAASANKVIGEQIAKDLSREASEKAALASEWTKLDSRGKMKALIEADSETGGLFGLFKGKDIQEAYGELEEDARDEVVDYMAETYANSVRRGASSEEAVAAAELAASRYLGLEPPKAKTKEQQVAREVSTADLMAQLQALEAQLNESGNP